MSIIWRDGEVEIPPGAVAIYVLADPINQHFRYIGQTRQPEVRYKAHLRTMGHQTNKAKADWIMRLSQQGLEPEMLIAFIVPEHRARDVELAFIGRERPHGSLTNQEVITREEHNERIARLGWHPEWCI